MPTTATAQRGSDPAATTTAPAATANQAGQGRGPIFPHEKELSALRRR